MESKDKITLALSAWGAVISTALAAVRVYEAASKQPKLVTTYSFTTDRSRGNTVSLLNVSSTPAVILHWELVRAERRVCRRRSSESIATSDDIGPYTLGAHDVEHLRFCEEAHFAWSLDRTGDQIYLKLILAGRRRPKWLKVWPS